MVGNNKSVKRPKLMDLFTVSIIRSISALLFLYLDSPHFIPSRTALEYISCVNKSGRPNIQMLGSLGVIQLPLSNTVSSYLTKNNIFFHLNNVVVMSNLDSFIRLKEPRHG